MKRMLLFGKTLSEKHQAEYFEKIYKEYFDRLFGYAMAITKNKQLAEDVVSELFLNLWNLRSGFSKIMELESYLMISVKNLSIRAITKDPKNIFSLDLENSIRRIEKLDPEEVLLEKELRLAIDQAIEALPEQCKLVYRMVKDNQMKNSEVAAELGISEGTVKNQLLKAVARIREKVRDHLSDHEPYTDHYTRLGAYAFLFLASLELLLLKL